MLEQKRAVRTDFLVVVGMILFFIPLVLLCQVRFITSTLLFFAVPALYLYIRRPKQISRIWASIVAGTVVAFLVDFLAEVNGAWSWAPQGQLIFPDKIMGVVPVDVLIWYFLWIAFTVIYYEHFFEHERAARVSRRFVSVLLFFVAATFFLTTIYSFVPEFLSFHYAYLFLGIFGALPFFFVVVKKPRLAAKLFKAGLFNIFVFLSFELTALKLDQWRFPGEYIGVVSLFGVQFPLEEFFFWIVLGTPIILSYYELFIDDGK